MAAMKHRLTDAKTLDRAQEALSSDVRPDSVEILKDGRARIWFELGDYLGESLGEYCHHVPGRWFEGRKKREKWAKEDRIVRQAAVEKRDQELHDLIGPLVNGRRGFYFEPSYTPMAFSASLSVKGGPNALVQRDLEDRAASHFVLTLKAKAWLRANLTDFKDCEFWGYGDQAQLFFKLDNDRLNFVKWSSTLNKKKGKK